MEKQFLFHPRCKDNNLEEAVNTVTIQPDRLRMYLEYPALEYVPVKSHGISAVEDNNTTT